MTTSTTLLRAASRRFFLTSTTRRSLQQQQRMIGTFVPSSQQRRDNNNHDDQQQQTQLLLQQQRYFSASAMNNNKENNNTHDPSHTYSERARAGMTKARQGYQDGAKRGKAMAKAGSLSAYEKLKQYGPVFMGTYTCLYVGTLASLYAGVDSGLIDPATLFSYIGSGSENATDEINESKNTAEFIIDYMNHYPWTQPAVPFFEKNPHFANLGVAWVATKFTEPFRLVVAMVVVPRLAKTLGYVIPEEEVHHEEEEHHSNDDTAHGASETAGEAAAPIPPSSEQKKE